jgi:hypothetical protein
MKEASTFSETSVAFYSLNMMQNIPRDVKLVEIWYWHYNLTPVLTVS